MAQGQYSLELEQGLLKLTGSAKNIIDICNAVRTEYTNELYGGYSGWREYHDDVLVIFETLNQIERGALMLVENLDVIRRKNERLRSG